MKTITFQNKGLIDLRAVKTFGASSKENKNPIGYFGTGLKYAIAVFLRAGCQVQLARGVDEIYEFKAKRTTIRVDEFDIVCMVNRNGEEQELAFTTELGRNWKPWQAMREIWCNAVDEDGDMYAGTVQPEEDMTTICVTGQAAADAYYDRDNVMLRGEPKWNIGGVEIHYKRSEHSYFRGIRVGDLVYKSRLTYNIVGHGMSLTEDRTLAHPHMVPHYIVQAIANAEHEDLLTEIIEAPRESYEGKLDFSDADPGPLLMRMLEEMDFRAIGNQTLLRMYRKTKGTSVTPSDVKLDRNEEIQLKKAISFCEAIGYEVTDYKIHITDDLEDHVLGRVHEGMIYVNRRTFMRGTKLVAGTILEEYLHIKHRLADESRAFQDYLIDAVITLGEQLLGEPL